MWIYTIFIKIYISCNFRLGKSSVGCIIRETCNYLGHIDIRCQHRKCRLVPEAVDFPSEWQSSLTNTYAVPPRQCQVQDMFLLQGLSFTCIVVNAQGCFEVIDVGSYMAATATGWCAARQWLRPTAGSKQLESSPSCIYPCRRYCCPCFVSVGDEAFPLKNNLMRPFPRHLNT